MTNDQAKFILCAYRAGGQDAGDPHFAPALEQARRDPALGQWLEREQALDAVTGERLRTVPPPAGLRDSILAGAQLDRPRPWWRQPAWLAAAAAVVLLAAAGLWRTAPGRPLEVDRLIRLAEQDVLVTHRTLAPETPGAVNAWLSDPAHSLRAGLPLTPTDLQADRCRIVQVAGIELFEVCFKRDVWYHIYIARRDHIEPGAPAEILFREQGRLATATWADARYVYVLATEAGLPALRQILD